MTAATSEAATISAGQREMTGAEMVVQAMIDHGVEHLFGYPGGAVLPIYDELFQQDKVQHILVRHEQGAGHAAEGYARSTGKVGVMLVTSGPGATNAVTPLQDALMDSIPLVCISGQVPSTTGSFVTLMTSRAFCTKLSTLLRLVVRVRFWLIFQRISSLRPVFTRHRRLRRAPAIVQPLKVTSQLSRRLLKCC
jgi:2-succinyl-5-enolpyruvyl-6-hydroxy-3-cyclohexene-1-carboxylate synthase